MAAGVRELEAACAGAEALSCPALTWRLARALGRAHEQGGAMVQALQAYAQAAKAVQAAAGQLSDPALRETFLASAQVTVIRDALARLEG